ncbi:hypothetical protein IFM47457_08540 [Aspergillus lentulus]|nr:hypothetical protein IFM47457_08540 [Aspergillus lentulus]
MPAFTGVTFLRNPISIGVPFAISPWMQRIDRHVHRLRIGFISLAITMTIIPMEMYGKKMRVSTAGRYRLMAAQQGQ